MLKTLLGLEDNQQITGLDFSLENGWLIALALLLAAMVLVIYLYATETRLQGRQKVFLGLCKGMALLVLIVILLEPFATIRMTQPSRRTVLVLLDTSGSMGIEDPRTTPEDVREAAIALNLIPPNKRIDAAEADSLRKQLEGVSRFDLAKAALSPNKRNLLSKLEEKYDVQLLSFHDQLRSEKTDPDSDLWKENRKPGGKASLVGTLIEEAVARYTGQPLAGVVIFSDFAWTDGKDPVQVARQLKKQGIPVFPVAIGLPQPPDIRVRRIIAPEVVFKGDRVPIRAQIESHGFEGATAEITLSIEGDESTRERIELKEGAQFVEMMFIPEKQSGAIRLELSIEPKDGEIKTENNTRSHSVQVVDQKIKVLYIEGMPRWEYRYLRWVLLRDPRLDVRFLMTQGDPKLAATSPQHVDRFPQVAKDAFQYDLIILGDVPASYFNDTQLGLMRDLVKKRSGSLLMVAGPVGAPASYRDTPIADILPVKPGNGQWHSINVGPVVTPEGRESLITRLTSAPETTARIWANVRPMYLPPLEGAKPGATVLLTKPKEAGQLEDYPLVAWQRYGTGKSMFVATEDLWRMRLEVGDRYHARFWGQAIQFLALSRLLGKNKQINLETDRLRYSAGEQVQVYANVLTQSFDPVVQSSYPVVVDRPGVEDAPTELELSPVPDTPGLYIGTWMASEDGSYRLRTKDQDAEISNEIRFDIVTVPMEDRETGMQPDVARQVAEQSGGKGHDLLSLEAIPAELGDEKAPDRVSRLQIDLWDTPVLFILLVVLAGIEWYMRRKNNLI